MTQEEETPMFDRPALEALNATLSSPDGMTVDDLRDRLDTLFGRERPARDLQAYREGDRPWKKLADEVVPVSEFLSRSGAVGHVRFPLDDQPPDAWFREAGREGWTGIEVTRALGRAKYDIARDLRDQPMGRGFLGLADDAKPFEYESARKRRRITASAAAVRRDIETAIKVRIEAKSDPKYADHILIVAAPLGSGGPHDWEPTRLRLVKAAQQTAFRRVIILDEARCATTPLLIIDLASDAVSS